MAAERLELRVERDDYTFIMLPLLNDDGDDDDDEHV